MYNMDRAKKLNIEVLEQIGVGGFGTVYKCMFNGKKHVIKRIPISEDTQMFKTVSSEFEILNQIRHPRVLKMVTFYQTSTDWNFVLEFMGNGSLRETLNKYKNNRWKFGQADLLNLFMDIADGLKHLHNNKIIHRDLKPENILVDENHRLKIADFGVSKLLLDHNPNYHTAIGTMMYMAPEVYLHQPYDKSVDVWALGLIFYEMAMQNYPFSPVDKSRIMNPFLVYVTPKIDYVRRKYDETIQDMLALMLQRDPTKRADLEYICNMPIVQKIQKQLVKEELTYSYT